MQVEDDSQNINDLEKEVIELATETNVLKKSAPEANDESNIQYFLAIAELGKVIFWLKISPLDCTPLTQHAQWILNNIEKTFNRTFTGWKSMHQVFRKYFSWNPRLKAIETAS